MGAVECELWLTSNDVPSGRDTNPAFCFHEGDALIIDQRAADDYASPGTCVVGSSMVHELDGQERQPAIPSQSQPPSAYTLSRPTKSDRSIAHHKTASTANAASSAIVYLGYWAVCGAEGGRRDDCLCRR